MVLLAALKELLCASQAHKGGAWELPGSTEEAPRRFLGDHRGLLGAPQELPEALRKLAGGAVEIYSQLL